MGNNIYVVGKDGKRTGDVIGQTQNPWDFLLTSDQDGTFTGPAKGVTFDLKNLPNRKDKIQSLTNEWILIATAIQSTMGSLATLATLSRNGEKIRKTIAIDGLVISLR